MNFLDAAQTYFDRGWTSIPLVLDDNGFPKRPFSAGWQQTPHEWDVISALPWDRAKGLGLVLGPASDNLAVIDLDDEEFATELFRTLGAAHSKFYAVRTGRNNGHVYFREGTATDPHTYRYTWHGRTFSIELKGRGQQVAAPPTPGYSLAGTAPDPTPVGTLAEAWRAIAQGMGVDARQQERPSSGYGTAWRDSLAEGERNNALYVESCRLAEARMPLQSAIATMIARVQVAYQGQFAEREVVRTVQSAYRRVNKPKKGWITV